MHLRSPAIVCSLHPHGETGAVARVLTAEHGLVAGYVAGGRGRQMRPVLIPGNTVDVELRARSASQLPALRAELLHSRAPWHAEPLAALAIGWACALTAAALPERHAYPALHSALEALLDAVCHAPSARGWVPALLGYEVLLLRDMGYGGDTLRPDPADWNATLAAIDALRGPLLRYPLAERRGDVMAARDRLRERLARIPA